jgi:hypothetical protein
VLTTQLYFPNEPANRRDGLFWRAPFGLARRHGCGVQGLRGGYWRGFSSWITKRTGAASAAPCPPARERVFLGSTWSLDFSPVGTRPQSRSKSGPQEFAFCVSPTNTRNSRTGNNTDHNSCRRKHKSLYRSDGHPNDRGRYCRDLSRPCGRRNHRGPSRGQSRDLHRRNHRYGLLRRGLHRRLVRTRLCRSSLSLCRARWP